MVMQIVDEANFFEKFPSRKLNLGCGVDIRDDYTNVDMHDYRAENTIVADITRLDGFPSGAFEQIIAFDIVEHIRHAEIVGVLCEWNRVLEVGGHLHLRTTNLNGLVRLMERAHSNNVKAQRVLLTNLFSRQLVPGDYHYNAFTELMIRFDLWAARFEILEMSILDDWIWNIKAIKKSDVVPQSLETMEADDLDFLNLAYMTILNRPADELGRSSYKSRMSDGMTRRQVVREMIESGEFQNIVESTAPAFKLDFYQPNPAPTPS